MTAHSKSGETWYSMTPARPTQCLHPFRCIICHSGMQSTSQITYPSVTTIMSMSMPGKSPEHATHLSTVPQSRQQQQTTRAPSLWDEPPNEKTPVSTELGTTKQRLTNLLPQPRLH